MFAHCKFSLFLFKVVTRVLTVLLSFLISTFWFSLRSFPVAIQLSGNHSKKKNSTENYYYEPNEGVFPIKNIFRV